MPVKVVYLRENYIEIIFQTAPTFPNILIQVLCENVGTTWPSFQ